MLWYERKKSLDKVAMRIDNSDAFSSHDVLQSHPMDEGRFSRLGFPGYIDMTRPRGIGNVESQESNPMKTP